jgi:hypothetical protein
LPVCRDGKANPRRCPSRGNGFDEPGSGTTINRSATKRTVAVKLAGDGKIYFCSDRGWFPSWALNPPREFYRPTISTKPSMPRHSSSKIESTFAQQKRYTAFKAGRRETLQPPIPRPKGPSSLSPAQRAGIGSRTHPRPERP